MPAVNVFETCNYQRKFLMVSDLAMSLRLTFCKQFGIHLTCNATRMQAGKAMQRGIQVGLVLASISTRSRALMRCIGCCRLVDFMSSRLHCVVTVHSLHSRRLPSRRWCSYEPTRLVCFCGAEESASVGCACLGGHMHWVLQVAYSFEYEHQRHLVGGGGMRVAMGFSIHVGSDEYSMMALRHTL